MSFIAILKLLIVASVVLSVFALALRARAADVLLLFREWRLGAPAFLAMFIVVPVVAALVVSAFDLKPEVKIAIVVLSVSPIPPLLPKRQMKAGADGAYITGLLVAAALVSPIVAPLGLSLFGRLFGVDIDVSPAKIATTLGITIVAPLLAGLAARRWLGDRAGRLSDIVGKVAGLMLALCGLVLLVLILPAAHKLIGGGTLLALAGMIVAGLVAGHLLGPPGNRSALSLAAATRHPGVAMGIVGAAFPEAKAALVVILLYVVLGILLAIPYIKLFGNRSAETGGA